MAEELTVLTLEDYFTGPDGTRRDILYAQSMSAAIYDNASRTVEMANRVLAAMFSDGVLPAIIQRTGLPVASGWRPSIINERTANAAEHSKHLTGQAIDIEDTVDRALASWCLANESVLRDCGVMGMERPQWTPSWVHWQWVGVASGHFFYVPSSAPAKVAALSGELS